MGLCSRMSLWCNRDEQREVIVRNQGHSISFYFVAAALLGAATFVVACSSSKKETPKKSVALETKSNSVGIDMVKIPAGSFMMAGCEVVGCPKDDPFAKVDESLNCTSSRTDCKGFKDEVAHKVTLTGAFYLSKTEVTQKQYYAVMGSRPSTFESEELGYRSENNPVERVSWFDAIKFANALSKKEGLPACYDERNLSSLQAKLGLKSTKGNVIGGKTVYACKGYRLPTEAEWEYAARAGTKGARYGKLDDIAWYGGNSGEKTHPVGKKKPNAFGLYDMLGNVDEWCHDRYWHYPTHSENDGSYTGTPQTNPEGPKGRWGHRNLSNHFARVTRGGSWRSTPRYVRAAPRGNNRFPSFGDSFTGFRLARSAP